MKLFFTALFALAGSAVAVFRGQTLPTLERSPWLVSIVNRKTKAVICGGALVTANKDASGLPTLASGSLIHAVLTAASCLVDHEEEPVVLTFGRATSYTNTGLTRGIKSFETFSDLALITLSSPLPSDSGLNIAPIILPSRPVSIATPTHIFSAGWGVTSFNGAVSSNPRVGTLYVQPCRSYASNPNVLCTAAPSLSAPCTYDQGNPLVREMDPSASLMGIVRTPYCTLDSDLEPAFISTETEEVITWLEEQLSTSVSANIDDEVHCLYATLTIVPDKWKSDISWSLTQEETGESVVAFQAGSAWPADNTFLIEAVCSTSVTSGYTFNIYDKYRDGLCANPARYGCGYYSLDIGGIEVARGSKYVSSEHTHFVPLTVSTLRGVVVNPLPDPADVTTVVVAVRADWLQWSLLARTEELSATANEFGVRTLVRTDEVLGTGGTLGGLVQVDTTRIDVTTTNLYLALQAAEFSHSEVDVIFGKGEHLAIRPIEYAEGGLTSISDTVLTDPCLEHVALPSNVFLSTDSEEVIRIRLPSVSPRSTECATPGDDETEIDDNARANTAEPLHHVAAHVHHHQHHHQHHKRQLLRGAAAVVETATATAKDTKQ